jgi:hypothetical protein
MRYDLVIFAAVAAQLSLSPSNAWAADAGNAALARVVTKTGKAYVGELIKNDQIELAIRDLDTGTTNEFKNESLAKVEAPLSDADAARYLGLPNLMAWKISQLPNESPSIGKIAKITPSAIYLNIGHANGIVPGQELFVYRKADPIIDPDTKKVLTNERQRLAKLRVIEVAREYSKAKMLGDLEIPLAVGDEVQPPAENLLVAVLPIEADIQDETGKVLEERLITTLTNKGIPIIERALLDKVLGEQLLQHSFLFDEKTAQHIGKQLGASAVLTGKIVGRGEAHVRLVHVRSGRILLAASKRIATVRPSTPEPRTQAREARTSMRRREANTLSSDLLPGFILASADAYLTKDGLEVQPGSIVRTERADYVTGDFVFEIIYTFPKTATRDPLDQITYFGIGGDNVDERLPRKCVALAIYPTTMNGQGPIKLARTSDGRGSYRDIIIGHNRKLGPHRVWIEKVGAALTFRVDVDNDGETPDDLEFTIPDISEYAPYLNEKNSFLFIGGGANFTQGRLTRSRNLNVVPNSAALQASNMLPVRRGKPWPAFLQPGDNTLIVRDGLEVLPQTYVATKRADFVEKDFTFEVELVFPSSSDRQILDQIVHIAIGAPHPGQSPDSSVYTSIRPPDVNDGYVDVAKSERGRAIHGSEKRLTNLRSRGPHIFRIQKKGSAVTFAVDVDADGKSDDDAQLTIPDLGEYAPFLHNKNSHLLFGGGARFTKVRLSIEK